MTRTQYHEGNDVFVGLWTNADGHVLLIESNSDYERLFVSFAPTMKSPPAKRSFCGNKPTIRMPAAWREDFFSLIVRLHPNETEPSLHLTPDNSGFYYEELCLIPGLSDYASSIYSDKQPALSWMTSLKPYRRTHKEYWHEFRLVADVDSILQ